MAGTTTEIIALRAFPYSKNGISVENAAIGDIVTLDARVAQGLVDEGFAELASGAHAEKPAGGDSADQATTAPPKAETHANSDSGASVAAPAADAAPDISIPSDWAVMHHIKQINLAKQIDPAVTTKAEAVAAIEAYLAAKAE